MLEEKLGKSVVNKGADGDFCKNCEENLLSTFKYSRNYKFIMLNLTSNLCPSFLLKTGKYKQAVTI